MKFDNDNAELSQPETQEKKINPALKYLHELHRKESSPQLQEFLSCFAEPKPITPETFATGVKKFIQLANSNSLDISPEYNRKTLYGNKYSGLHYNNDLVKLWNSQYPDDEPIQAHYVSTLAPSDWDSIFQDGYTTLVYKGQQPAQALDQLIKGPTVIDCGIFAQLSFWFGIRYVLGNERFNQCFGRTPFFITQLVYNQIKNSDVPWSGNPLYSFFSTKENATTPSVTARHLKNSPLYHLKHPGGNYGGENCIIIDGQYYIFDPHLEHTQGLSQADVFKLLRQSFNQEKAQYDIDRLSLYTKQPDKFHPKLMKTFGQLIETAAQLSQTTLTEKEFLNVKQDPALELTFDLYKFSHWLECIENNTHANPSLYFPLTIDSSSLPTDLLHVIPFENRDSMSFSSFKQDTPQQHELMTISKQFCHNIMANESKLVILSGKAGVGKTASAVCAAKELTARGKKIVWISEVMVHQWAEQAQSFSDLNKCWLEIDNLLNSNPDAVFLDDDNLAGYGGHLLLEKIYSWYAQKPGRGLFITSNDPIIFKKCYGYQLDGTYHYPPFNDYVSPQYLNWQHVTDLNGASLRSRKEGQSIGAIVDDAAWQAHAPLIGMFELIPAFDEEHELAPIRRSLRDTGTKGEVYNKLSPIQQRWLHVHQVSGLFNTYRNKSHYEEPHLTANPTKFEKTNCKTIALEITKNDSSASTKEVDTYAMWQLVRVLNYAHDQGGRRVILINKTGLSPEQLVIEIRKQLPEAERERTWSRFMLLLCETENTIFKLDQFNDRIKEPVVQESRPGNVGRGAFSRHRWASDIELMSGFNVKNSRANLGKNFLFFQAQKPAEKISEDNMLAVVLYQKKENSSGDRNLFQLN